MSLKDLSDEELTRLEQLHGANLERVSDADLDLMERAQQSESENGSAVKTVGGIISAAQRAGRAMGVAGEALMTDESGKFTAANTLRAVGNLMPGAGVLLQPRPEEISRAIEGAKAAFQPGFEPAEGQRLGAAIGGAAPLMALGPAAGIAANAIGQGGETAATTGDAEKALKKAVLTAIIDFAIPAAFKLLQKGHAAIGGALSGAGRETLEKIAEDPGALLPRALGGPGTVKEAGEAVGAAATSAGKLSGKLRPQEIPRAADVVEKARALAKEGLLNPGEANIAKREIGDIGRAQSGPAAGDIVNRVGKEYQVSAEDAFKEIERQAPDIVAANRRYGRAVTGDRASSLFPINRGGDVSTGRTLAALAAGAAGGPMTALAASPLANALVQAFLGPASKLLAKKPQVAQPLIDVLSKENK